MMKFALSQNVAVLRETMKKTKSLSSVELPENLVDLMYETMSASGESVHLVSVRDVLYSAIPLPFMPDRIDYKIGKGCCDEIVKCDGLFVPCSKQCDGDKCAKHLKTPTGLGNYCDRHAAWSKNEPYCVIIKDKEVKEKAYGTYLHSKKLDSVAVTEELSKWGVSLQLDPSLFRAPAKPLKKSRGRKAEKKVESTESDEESEESESEKSESEKSDEETPKKKTKPRPKVAKPEPEAEPEAETEPEPESEAESDDEALGQLTSKIQAIAIADPDPESDLEKPPSDDEDEGLRMISKAKPKSEPKSEPKTKPKTEKPKTKPKTEKPKTEKKRSESPKTEKKRSESPKTEKKRSESPELKKERLEEKPPKKGAIYKGNKDSLSEVVYEDEAYVYKDGKYYHHESLELIAWDNKGEFELL